MPRLVEEGMEGGGKSDTSDDLRKPTSVDHRLVRETVVLWHCLGGGVVLIGLVFCLV